MVRRLRLSVAAAAAGTLMVVAAWRRPAEHIQLLVMSVAACQALVAFGLAVGRAFARIGLVGATCFLLAIAPLGVGSGFPSTLLLAIGAILLWRRSDALEGGLLQRIIRAMRRTDRTSRAA